MDIIVRQAHPGPAVPPYRSFEAKMRDAEAYQRENGIPWPVLVDDLAGTVHQVYGGLSDPLYLIDTDGRVAYYNMVSYAPVMHEAMAALLAQGGKGVVKDGIDHVGHLFAPLVLGWPALRRGLPQSVWDLMIATPGSPLLVWLGWQLRPLLGPLARRSRPLPVAAQALLAVGLVALAMAVWLLLRRKRLPVRERHTTRPIDREEPTAIPEEALHGERPVQMTDDGTGPMFHRRYRADMANPTRSAEELMALLQREPNDFAPRTLATFEKTKGEAGQMAVGDDYYIHITGPWDGPVRVIEVTPTCFSLLTLEGHMEAGEIRFRFVPHPRIEGGLRFEILSWARSRDTLVDIAYRGLGLAKAAQTNMWVHFCQRIVEESGGELVGEIAVVTEEQPYQGEVIPNE